MIFQKALFGPPFCAAGRQTHTTPNDELRPGADPAFHETKVIIVPFGPTFFLNIIFSMKIG